MRTTLSILLLVALAIPAGAHHCTTYSTTTPQFDSNPTGIGPRFYVINEPCFGGGSAENTCLFSIWVYQESNGVPGLQRGDEVRDDTCHGMIASDTIFF